MNTTTATTPTERAIAALDNLLTQRARIDGQIREALRIVDATQKTGRRSRLVIPDCGSETAYQRHRHTRDTATEDRRVTCGPCLEAHRLHARISYARSRYGDEAAAYVERQAARVGNTPSLSVTDTSKRAPDAATPHPQAMNNDDAEGAA